VVEPMIELKIKGAIHDGFYTFETTLMGNHFIFSEKENENTIVIPIYNLAAEDERLTTTRNSDTVYIDKSFFIFKVAASLDKSGAVHTPDKKDFTNKFSEHHDFATPGTSTDEYYNYELGSFGLLNDGATYDGQYKIKCQECILLIPVSSKITTEYPGPVMLDDISKEIKSFLLTIPGKELFIQDKGRSNT
jgi:hypothetical protein